jgi:hypothetical protein
MRLPAKEAGMADDRLKQLTKLKALQQLRLAREQAELGGLVARTAEAASQLRNEEELLEGDQTRQLALLSADGFDPSDLKLAGLVLEQQQQAALLASRMVNEREREEQKARQAVATCEAQADNVEEAFRKAHRKSIEKADGALAIELAALGCSRKERGQG